MSHLVPYVSVSKYRPAYATIEAAPNSFLFVLREDMGKEYFAFTPKNLKKHTPFGNLFLTLLRIYSGIFAIFRFKDGGKRISVHGYRIGHFSHYRFSGWCK